jgi:large subunit ribosomal protein L3
MSLGLIGRKVGMMRIVEGDQVIPVTVIEASSNRVAQLKTTDNDGYTALQLAYGSKKPSRLNKAQAGHLAKSGVQGAEKLHEFLVSESEAAAYQAGGAVSVEIFAKGQLVDVTGTSIGKGFTGTIRRHNFSSQRASHGNSRSHNVPGSIGMAQDPGRVFPGKRMAGHMGDVKVTVQNLSVERVDTERGLILVRGAIPGSKGTLVTVRPAVKAKA